MRELQERRRWGARAVWAFAALLALVTTWVFAPLLTEGRGFLQTTASDATKRGVASTDAARRLFPFIALADGREEVITGHVRFDDGVPVAGADVRCYLKSVGPEAEKTFGGHATAEDGSFRILVPKAETYTVQARFGDAWASPEVAARAGTRDLEFLVPNARRLTLRVLNDANEQLTIRHASVVWSQKGRQARSRTEEPSATLILPALADVDGGAGIVVGLKGWARYQRVPLSRSQLARGPLSLDLPFEPPLAGSWNLRVRLQNDNGTPYQGVASLHLWPMYTARRRLVRDGSAVFGSLDRNFDHLRVVVLGWASPVLDIARPSDGASVEVSFKLPEVWTVAVAPRFERRLEAHVGAVLSMWRVTDPALRAPTTGGPPWTVTGMGAGHWWARITVNENGKPPLQLWLESLMLSDGDEITLNPWIPDKKPAEKKD